MSNLYRQNVGIILCRAGKVLLCARADQKDFHWQFPQGGIEADEDVLDAAKRELREETGITAVRLINIMPQPLKYDFPKDFRSRHTFPYIGQEQYWVLFEFLGKDEDIDFCTNPQEIEFKAFKWADIAEAPKEIIYFKKDVYAKVADYFAPYVKETINDR